MQALGTTISSHILMMFPYLLTVAVLVFTSTEKMKVKVGAPAALGVPYSREEKS
jgi:simple sugar transport system permease protein